MGKIKDMLDSPEMEDFRKAWKEQQEKYKLEATEFWNNLSYDDSLKAFYYVTSKIYEGDVEKRSSYRGVLYEIFRFDMDSYTIGMECNYLNLHNIIYDGVDFSNYQRARIVKIGDTVLEVSSNERLNFSFDEETKELTIKTVDIFKEN